MEFKEWLQDKGYGFSSFKDFKVKKLNEGFDIVDIHEEWNRMNLEKEYAIKSGEAFIGWISTDPNNPDMEHIAEEMNDLVGEYGNKFYTTSTNSPSYMEIGLVFSKIPISKEEAEEYFEKSISNMYSE